MGVGCHIVNKVYEKAAYAQPSHKQVGPSTSEVDPGFILGIIKEFGFNNITMESVQYKGEVPLYHTYNKTPIYAVCLFTFFM